MIYTLFPIDEAQLISISTKIFTILKGRGRGCGEGLGTESSGTGEFLSGAGTQHPQPVDGSIRKESIWCKRKTTLSKLSCEKENSDKKKEKNYLS